MGELTSKEILPALLLVWEAFFVIAGNNLFDN
jgi:hypothetical protein